MTRRSTRNSLSSSKINLNGKRARETDDDKAGTEDGASASDGDDEENTKTLNGTTTRKPSGKIPYAALKRTASQATSITESTPDTPVSSRRATWTSLARTRSRRTTITSTPATSEPPHTSDGEILTDDSLQYKDISSEESSGSEFEDSASESDASQLDLEAMHISTDDENSMAILAASIQQRTKGGRQNGFKAKKGKSVQGIRNGMNVGDADDTDEEMLNAAIRESVATAAAEDRAKYSSAGAGPSATRSDRMSMSVSPKKGKGKAVTTADASDSDNLPLASKATKGKGKGAQQDIIVLDSSDDDAVSGTGLDAMDIDAAMELLDEDEEEDRFAQVQAQAEADRISRAIQKKEEAAERKRLGRRLTFAEKATIALYRHHPELKTVWADLEKLEILKAVPGVQPASLKLKLLPFQLESLTWMRRQEENTEFSWNGGLLADEMGLGKTIQTLGLLVSDPRKPNLVVAPTVAIMQWKNEIDQHTSGLAVNVFHGASRTKDIEALKKCDIVLTTYAVLESVYRKQQYGFKRKGQLVKERSILHEITWARIILDEAHNIKERSTSTAKAAFELDGKFRWCLSGTPLQNRVGELYSLVRFLGGDPFSYYFCKKCPCKSLHWKFTDKRSCDECKHPPSLHVCLWNNEILGPIQKHGFTGPGQDAFRKLRILLDRMMLRRTKLERADDLGLPPRTVIVRRDYFSPEEKELYLSLFSDAKRKFSTYVDAGTVLNNYSNIFTLITRMRQMACHPDLVLKSKKNAEFSGDIVEATVCRLCNDIAEDAIESKCHHVFDRECIRQYLEASAGITPECPVCHLPLTIDLEAEAIEISEENVNKARQGILGRLDLEGWRSSSKIEALVEELSKLRDQDRTIKSIVFSQFVNFLDLIAFRLKKAGFNICRLEGTMTPQARDLTIKHFMTNVDVTVFLVSLKAGGVALNLTEASRVYLMDSWWNPAVEYQAMDRIHRIGQHRPIQAIKLVIEDSIESRIVQLQEKKSAMVEATLSTDDSAMGRLTPEDLSFLFRL